MTKLSDLSPAARAQAERLLGVQPRKPRQPQDTSLEDNLAFQIKVAGLPTPARQHRFMAPEREFRFDFSWPERMLAVEVDGGTHVNGAHNRGHHYESDCVKFAEAAWRGWRVLRVTSKMVEDGRALLYIERCMQGTLPRVLP